MKKTIAMLLMAGAVTSAAYATNYWNLNWGILDAFSPKDADGDFSPALLEDYSVTWKLVYGDDVMLNTYNQLSGGTVIAEMSAAAGSTYIGWTETIELDEGGTITREGRYGADLYLVDGYTKSYLGVTTEDKEKMIYQYIEIWGPAAADGETGGYSWLSEGVSYAPVTDTRIPARDLGGIQAELGHSSNTSGYVTDAFKPITIPEPATMSLLGLGALAMVLRRKIRK